MHDHSHTPPAVVSMLDDGVHCCLAGAPRESSKEGIDVSGMACWMPWSVGAVEASQDSTQEKGFSKMVTSGADAIVSAPLARWDIEQYYNIDAIVSEDQNAKISSGRSCTRHGSFVEGAEFFDNTAFSISAAAA